MIKNLLRGIGIGCILAGGILYIGGTDQPAATTDKELSDLKSETALLKKELASTKEALAEAQTVTSVKTEEKNEAEVKKETSSPDETSEIVKSVLSIEQGSNSTSVSSTLERLGIIKNAQDFNDYLTSHKLEGKIQIGEHEVDSSMDFKTLANRITKGR